MTRYVGVDLHRRRSVIVVLDGDGTELWTHRIDNDPLALGLEIEAAGPEPEVVLEATWGWYWAADVIAEAGGRVHLAHQTIPGVGPVLGAIFTAELGDVTRFGSAKRVNSWAGLTPRHRESDSKVHRGSITKQGPPLVRWAAIEAVSKNHGGDPIKQHYHRVAERRGKNKGRVAAARKLLTLVYYGLRDGEIRSLAPPEAA